MTTPFRAALRRFAPTVVAAVAALATVSATAVAAVAAIGVDVSSHQHDTSLNWSAVKRDGVSFAFIKATEGRTYTNPYFASDWAATRRVGIYHGAYHFAWPSHGTAGRQARYFVSKAGLAHRAGDLPPVLDLEETGGLGVRGLRAWVSNWLTTVHDLTGRRPIIYVSPYFWRTYLRNSHAFTQYPLWVANYGVSSPDVPGGWSTWTFWQNTSSGRVKGIGGRVDMNKFHGTRAALARLANIRNTTSGSGTPTGPTAPTGPTDPTGSAVGTITSLELSPSTVYPDRRVTFSGRLTSATGKELAGRDVTLWRRTSRTTPRTKVASVKTDPTGHYSVTLRATASARFRAAFAGGSRFTRSTSQSVTLTVRSRVDSLLDLHAGRSSIAQGDAVRLYGHLTAVTGFPLPGRQVEVYRRPSGSTEWVLARKTTSLEPGGRYRVRVKPGMSTTYKAVYAGGARYNPATSDRVTITVR